MATSTSPSSPTLLPTIARLAFALTMVWLGVLGLNGGFLPPAWSGIADTFPGHVAIGYLCAVVSLVAGVGMLFPRTLGAGSALLVAAYALWFLLVRITHIFTAPTGLDTWWAFGDTFVMGGAPLVLYARSASAADRWRFTPFVGEQGVWIAQLLYGVAMIPFGIAHFLYLAPTAALVPSYLPWHLGVAFATGCAFHLTALAVFTRKLARLAVTLSVVQMALFTLLVWVPVVIAGPNAGQWAEFLNSVGLTTAGWVVAESYRART